MNAQSVERLILVVEDNPEHLSRIEAALGESKVPHRLVTIANGTDALNYLYRRGDFVDAMRPDLILLDLSLPDKDGRTILEAIKTNTNLRRIPTVVLTMSTEEEDIFNSYSLQGNCYVIKSEDLDQLFLVVKRVEEFWLGIVTLPLE